MNKQNRKELATPDPRGSRMNKQNGKELATPDPIRSLLTRYKGAIKNVLPQHLTPEKVLRVAYTVINKTPKLRQCSEVSIINAIIEASMLGLDIGRTAHIIPFGRVAVFIPDYKGFIDLAHRSNRIQAFTFKPVYSQDLFDYEEGTTRFIKHKPCRDEDRGQLVAAYAIVFFKHGGYDFEVIERADAMSAKERSPSKNKSDSPWNKPLDEWTMWCKTAVRRLAKRVPQSPDLQRAAFLEELHEAGLKQDLRHIDDVIELVPEGVADLKDALKTKKISDETAEDTNAEKETVVDKKEPPAAGKVVDAEFEERQGRDEDKADPEAFGKLVDEYVLRYKDQAKVKGLMYEHLNIIAEGLKVDPVTVAADLATDFEMFKDAFERWVTTRDQKEEKTEEGPPPQGTISEDLPDLDETHPWHRNNWKNKRIGNPGKKTGFFQYCLDNKETFPEAPIDIKIAVFDKHTDYYPDLDYYFQTLFCKEYHELTPNEANGLMECVKCGFSAPHVEGAAALDPGKSELADQTKIEAFNSRVNTGLDTLDPRFDWVQMFNKFLLISAKHQKGTVDQFKAFIVGNDPDNVDLRFNKMWTESFGKWVKDEYSVEIPGYVNTTKEDKPSSDSIIKSIKAYPIPIRQEVYKRLKMASVPVVSIESYERQVEILDLCGVVEREFKEVEEDGGY